MFMVDAIRSVFYIPAQFILPRRQFGQYRYMISDFSHALIMEYFVSFPLLLETAKINGSKLFLFLLCWHFCCMPCTDHHGICSSLRENTTINLARRKSSVTYPFIPREEPLGTPVPMTAITMNFGQSKEL